jgi:hypothetical protein
VQAQAGKFLLFFSQMTSGEEDPRSWYGGEQLRHGVLNNGSITEKKLLTIFKQVDYGFVVLIPATSTFETYLSHHIQTQSQRLLIYCFP